MCTNRVEEMGNHEVNVDSSCRPRSQTLNSITKLNVILSKLSL